MWYCEKCDSYTDDPTVIFDPMYIIGRECRKCGLRVKHIRQAMDERNAALAAIAAHVGLPEGATGEQVLERVKKALSLLCHPQDRCGASSLPIIISDCTEQYGDDSFDEWGAEVQSFITLLNRSGSAWQAIAEGGE